jgi:hypothetical protein
LSVAELQAVLTNEGAELGNVNKYELKNGVPLPSSLLTEEELERILDRSPEAYEKASTSACEKFAIVETVADQMNNALVADEE